VHRQVVDNTVREREKNYTQTYIERMSAQNEEREKKKKLKKKSDHRSKKRINIVRTTERCFLDIQ